MHDLTLLEPSQDDTINNTQLISMNQIALYQDGPEPVIFEGSHIGTNHVLGCCRIQGSNRKMIRKMIMDALPLGRWENYKGHMAHLQSHLQ